MFLGYKAKSWELLQTLCGPNLFPHYYNLGYLFANFITILMTIPFCIAFIFCFYLKRYHLKPPFYLKPPDGDSYGWKKTFAPRVNGFLMRLNTFLLSSWAQLFILGHTELNIKSFFINLVNKF